MSKFKFTHFLKEFSICIIIITIILGAFILPLKSVAQTTQNDFEKVFIAPKSDTVPPVIAFLQNRPQNPEWYDDINITVEVYDANSGIKQVILSFSSDLDEYGGYRNITMTHLMNDLYNCTIPHSIYVKNNGFGDIVKYKVYASDQAGNWAVSPEKSYYMNDTVAPTIFLYSPLNNSFVSSHVNFNVSSFDNGSGISSLNLTIYNQSGYKIASFESTENSHIFQWDSSNLPNFNSSNPLYYIANLTVKDKSTPQNINQTSIILYIDKTAPYISQINRLPCQNNSTITNQTIEGAIIQNSSIKYTYFNDTEFLSIVNGSNGIINFPLSINLSNFGIEYNLIDYINISISAKINNATNWTKQAGWAIYNWTGNKLYTINNLVFNTTHDQFDNFIINSTTLNNYISKENYSRIEIFLLLNSTDNVNTTFYVNYLNFHIVYNSTHWFNGNNFTISIWGNDSISFEKMVVHYQNITLFEKNTTYIGPCNINTAKIPDGNAVNINLTTYDRAGNIRSDIITIKNDHSGPNVQILSPAQNSTFGESGIWNTIVPITISGHEEYNKFKKMELYFNGQIQSVKDGQLGQIIETNATGYVIYKQTNSTWYKEGTYKFYWNASLIKENTTVNITLIGYDSLNNTNSYQLNITKCIFIENISFTTTTPDYIIENIPFILQITIKNLGNSTLYNYTPILNLPAHWTYKLYQYNPDDFLFLNPNSEQTIKFLITPYSVSKTKSFSLTLSISCKIVENFTQPINNFTKSLQITLTIHDTPIYLLIQNFIPIIISIVAGIGLSLFSFYLYYKFKIKSPKLKLA
ncbi:MAG: COG1470 family protein [Candidatus Helarchaeota archaeon]